MCFTEAERIVCKKPETAIHWKVLILATKD